MTDPVVIPTWMLPSQVGTWLGLKPDLMTPAETSLLAQCSAAVEAHVQRCRPDQFLVQGVIPNNPPTLIFTPDNEVRTAAVMLAARLYRRRNSPAGVELMGESIAYASRYDPEIDRALRTGYFSSPLVG